ncbi:Ubiquilin-1 [Cucumispora dikerogammari]|nr:Ubiquilin-1 [Cucumispora dikerogammari]
MKEDPSPSKDSSKDSTKNTPKDSTESTKDSTNKQTNENIKIIISFKQEDIPLSVTQKTTMKEIKETIIKEKKLDSQINNQIDNVKLLHTGRILENSKNVSDYQFTEGIKVYMILNVIPKSPVSTANASSKTNVSKSNIGYNANQQPNMYSPYPAPYPSSPYPSAYPPMQGGYPPQPGMGGGMYQNPNGSQLNAQLDVILNNPEMLDMVIQSTMPNVTEDQKPAVKEMLKKQMEMMKNNPQLMQQAMNNMPPLGAMPPPYNYNMPPHNPQAGYNNPPGSPNTQPMGSPYNYTYPQYNNNPYMQQYPQGAGGIHPQQLNMNHVPTAQHPPIDWDKAFEEQLKKLEEMGFKNKHLNMEALKKARGDVSIAVSYLSVWLDME